MGSALNHVGHVVADLPRSVAFYEALGFTVDRELSLPDDVVGPFLGVSQPCGFTAVYLWLGDFQLELMRFAEGTHPPAAHRVFDEPGLTHLSISVDDLDASVEAVGRLGGTVVSSSKRAAIVRDPDGQLLELLPMAFHEQTRSGPRP